MLTVALLIAVATFAQDPQAQPQRSAGVDVEVTPLRVEVKAGAGGAYTNTVRLVNHGGGAVRIHARIDDWYLSKDGTPQFAVADAATSFSASAWVRVNPVELVLQPNADATVRFTVSVPAGTADGGYRTAIMWDFSAEAADAAPAGQKGVAFKFRQASLVYLTVGSPKPELDLVDMQSRIAEGRPPVIVATLKNSGSVHVRTRGEMVVYDKAGAVVRKVPVPDVPVLPKSERDVVIPVFGDQQALPAGEYRVEARIDVGLPQVIVGETTITIAQ